MRSPRRVPSVLTITLIAAATLVLPAAGPAFAQRIDPETYIKYVPLEYPRVVRQNPATPRFDLYG